jgi:NTP-dependent ternary system trypsin peptidase co-occuring protein
MKAAQTQLEIRGLIKHAREQIDLAIQDRRDSGKAGRFEIQSLAIEVNVVVTDALEGEGGIDIWIVKAGGKKSYQREQVHKITLVLQPSNRGDDIESAISRAKDDLLFKRDLSVKLPTDTPKK